MRFTKIQPFLLLNRWRSLVGTDCRLFRTRESRRGRGRGRGRPRRSGGFY